RRLCDPTSARYWWFGLSVCQTLGVNMYVPCIYLTTFYHKSQYCFRPPIMRVSASVLRKLFNDSGYWEQYQKGQLQSILRKSKHPSAPLAKEPICTQSHYITYVNVAGEKIAGVHQ